MANKDLTVLGCVFGAIHNLKVEQIVYLGLMRDGSWPFDPFYDFLV
jgi:hypothetical protein